MGSKEFSEVKMANNWRTPCEQNLRLPGPQTPRYFIPRNNYTKCVNFESSTMTFLNRMLPKLSFNLCNSQIIDVNKLVTNRVDFYPDFEGITKIVQDSFQQKSEKDNSYSTSTDIFTLYHNKSNLEDLRKVSETKESIEETTKLDNQNNLENLPIENMTKKNMSMLQQTKHGTEMTSDIKIENKTQPKNMKHKNKKHKKSKRDKHKMKSETMFDILEDRFEDFDQDLEEIDEKLQKPIIKLSPSNLDIAKPSCSSRISQSIEKCWNYLQNLPSVKQIISTKNSTDVTDDANNFVYVHNINDGQLAIENITTKPTNNNNRRRYPSECDTEDSFVIFVEDDNESTISEDCKRKVIRQPSICESNDSFVICFGESSQSPTECFMFDDITERTKDTSDSEDDSEDDISDDSCDSTMCNGLNDVSRKVQKKKVRFDERPPKIHHMVKWAFAYRNSRMGQWETIGRDRERFRNRIENTKCVLDKILEKCHRDKVFRERFM